MRLSAWCVAIVAGLSLSAPQASFGQIGGGGMGGGGFGGGGFGGGGGMGGGLGGGALNQNQSMLNQLNQSIGSLPAIMGRPAQGTFGTRTLGSSSRQRFRMLMGRSQAGGGVGTQYASSGAFSQARRGTLPGSGMTMSGLTGSGMGTQQRTGTQQGASQPNAARPSNKPPGTGLANRKLKIRVGFEPPNPAAQRLTAGLQQRYSRVPGLSSVAATMVGRTVVLRGSAATDHASDLAEQLARLEPGIDVVRNELTTTQPLPAPRRRPPRSSASPSSASPSSANPPSARRQSPLSGPVLELPPPSSRSD